MIWRGHWLEHGDEFADLGIEHPVEYIERALDFSQLDPVPGNVRVGIARRPGPDNQPINVRVTMRVSTREFSSREILPDGTLGPMRTHFRPEYEELLNNWPGGAGNPQNPYLQYDPSNVAGWLGEYFKQPGLITELQ